MIEYIIDEEYESVRVDRFLRKHLKNINLSEIYKMLRVWLGSYVWNG